MTMARHFDTGSGNRQRGAVLIVGVIFLLVMTMLGITAMQTTSLEEKMSGNMRDRGLAFQAAEIALRAGDVDALNDPTGQGVFDVQGVPAPDESDENNWAAGTNPNFRAWTSNLPIQGVSSGSTGFPAYDEEPRYWIERQPNKTEGGSLEGGIAPPVQVFDITARSTGASGNSTVVLRSTVIY